MQDEEQQVGQEIETPLEPQIEQGIEVEHQVNVGEQGQQIEQQEEDTQQPQGEQQVQEDVKGKSVMSPPPKRTKLSTARKRGSKAATLTVTKVVPSKRKSPKRTPTSMPRRKSTRLDFKGKSKVGESTKHGGALAVIPIQSDDSDNEARLLENLLIHKEGQIEALEEDLQRARNFIHFLEIENKQ